MKTVFVGHRGVGKSELLKRHQTYFKNIPHFDLDAEIEKSAKQPLSDYFNTVGEPQFRVAEQEQFARLIEENSDFVIAVGAGFDVLQLPEDLKIVFISRVTDKDGRIFLNRPRLEKDLSPLEEFKKRYAERQPFYLQVASEIYDMPEGLEDANKLEHHLMARQFEVMDAWYTLVDHELPLLPELMRNYKKIELRTDMISTDIIEGLLTRHPQFDWMVSIRSNVNINLRNAGSVDCDYLYPTENADIFSVHIDSIDEALKVLDKRDGQHLKLCPLVENFEQLQMGYHWQQRDPENRSFLPRSQNGKWIWYRLVSKYTQKLNFIKSFTRIEDQPSLTEWLSLPKQRPARWAAVLGQPVYFSRSPHQHLPYFAERKSFFTKIEILKSEFETNMSFLIELGLGFAAVTSPLKEAADILADVKSGLGASNTLDIGPGKILAANTDLDGFKELTKIIAPRETVAVWGGGGTLDMMKSVLPQADFYSSQTGCVRGSDLKVKRDYDFLIWAAPRTGATQFPGEHLSFKEIIDLNYTQNSMGLEFAAVTKTGYTSGVRMFKRQALKQQQFWSEHERK